jgi:hypothetical protein
MLTGYTEGLCGPLATDGLDPVILHVVLDGCSYDKLRGHRCDRGGMPGLRRGQSKDLEEAEGWGLYCAGCPRVLELGGKERHMCTHRAGPRICSRPGMKLNSHPSLPLPSQRTLANG